MLTSKEKNLLTDTFLIVAADIDEASLLFYHHLLHIAPELGAMFTRTDMKGQGRLLMRMLDQMVEAFSTSKMDAIAGTMEKLGKRHTGYGIQRQHYEPFGEALIKTIADRLGKSFTPEVEWAWRKAYGILVDYATAHESASTSDDSSPES